MFDGYTRVSKRRGRAGPAFISVPVQEDAIKRYAASKGVEIRMSEPELDVTGSKLSRPILDGILERIREGSSEGIIVATVDRLSRAGLGDAIRLVEQIRAMGGTVGFAELDIDTVTPEGEFQLNIWLSVSRMQWRQYQRRFLDARGRAIKRGAFVGPTPIGYLKGPDGTLIVDETKRRQIWMAFASKEEAGGDSLLRYLRAYLPERRWSITTAEALITNPTYKGDLHSGQFVAHHPKLAIVSPEMWALSQSKRREVVSRSKLIPIFPLAGIAHCATCDGPLGAQWPKGKSRGYRCRDLGCTGRAHVLADWLEGLVLDYVRRYPPTLDEVEWTERRARVLALRRKLDGHQAARKQAQAMGGWAESAWSAELASIQEEIEIAQIAASPEVATQMPKLDRELSPAEMRRVFEHAALRITVRPGRGRLADRVTIQPAAAVPPATP